MAHSLDSLDHKIVRTFQEQPEISIADLADAIGLSQTPTWRRVKRLRSEGIFLKKAMIFDAKKLGFPINVLASVRLHRHDEETLEALERAASEQAQILECFSMSGLRRAWSTAMAGSCISVVSSARSCSRTSMPKFPKRCSIRSLFSNSD